MAKSSTVAGERIRYKGWDNVWRLRNGRLMMLVTADVGPRILHFGFEDGENEFYEVAEQAGKTGGDDFRMYGGHRLWVAPETERTNFPDNRPVEVEQIGSAFRFTAQPESTGLQKIIEIQFAPDAASVRVVHLVRNVSDRATNVTAWALSVLRPGGEAVLPLPPAAPHGPDHLLPATALTLWSYTDLTSPCWRLGPQYVRIQQSAAATQGFGMQKIGMLNKAGWGAYIRDRHVFIKRTPWIDGMYVDTSNFEIFANDKFIEVETLSPDRELGPGVACEHIEEWSLYDGSLDEAVLTLLT